MVNTLLVSNLVSVTMIKSDMGNRCFPCCWILHHKRVLWGSTHKVISLDCFYVRPICLNMVYDLERKLSTDHSEYFACGTCRVLTSCCYKIEVQVHTAFLTPRVQMTSQLEFASKTFSIVTDGWSGHRYFGLFLIVFLLNVVLKCVSHSFCI